MKILLRLVRSLYSLLIPIPATVCLKVPTRRYLQHNKFFYCLQLPWYKGPCLLLPGINDNTRQIPAYIFYKTKKCSAG
jgi:hypothetical protein